MSASMTARDNLIIILMWDVMNNSHTHTHTDKTHTRARARAHTEVSTSAFITWSSTLPASMSAAEVNALHSAAGKLAWFPACELQSLPRLFLEILDDTKSVAAPLLPALTLDDAASWSGATYSPNHLCLASRC